MTKEGARKGAYRPCVLLHRQEWLLGGDVIADRQLDVLLSLKE